MTKDVTVAELAEHLVEHLQEMRQGTSLRVIDGGKTLVTLTAKDQPLEITHPVPGSRLQDWEPPPPLKKPLGIDVVDLLVEERERDRTGKRFE